MLAEKGGQEHQDTMLNIRKGDFEGRKRSFAGGQPGYSTALLPPWITPLRPLVDLVAKIHVSVHAKLLFGFLVGALLLLGMALLSLVVIDRMSTRVEELTSLQDDMDRARRMEYLITAQSHFRAMALLTNDDGNNTKIALAKEEFLEHLDVMDGASLPENADLFNRARAANDRFTESSAMVLSLYDEGKIDEGLALHIAEEHKVSHEIEHSMRELQEDAIGRMDVARAEFESDKGLITQIVWTFSGVSLATAVLLGLVTSWSFIRPVRTIDNALAQIAQGNFTQRIEVLNRDEFGTLGSNLNHMNQQLASLYDELSSLNGTLQTRLDELQEAHRQLQEYAAQAGELATVQERNRLARELHDSVTQTIFSMTLTTEAAHILLQRDPSQVTPQLDRLQELAQGALSEMRSLIQQLRLGPVEEGRLVSALQKHLSALEDTEELKVDFHVEGEGQLPADQEEGLFRIAQEALNNVTKHANTDRVAVTLRMLDEEAWLLVEDHGVGFDPARRPANGQGFGLTSMRERVDILGGTLEVRSSPGQGTAILVKLPQAKGGRGQ